MLASIFQKTGLNWIDLIILCTLSFYAIEGIMIGALAAVFDFLKFILSFIIGLKTYRFVGQLLMQIFAITQGFSYALGFFIASFIGEIILHFLLKGLFVRIHATAYVQKPVVRRVNHILGIFPGVLSGVVLITFLLTVIVTLPVSPFLKKAISNAKLGSIFVNQSQVFEKELGNVFGGAAKDTLNFLTVEPRSSESVTLHFTTTNAAVDETAEKEMFFLVNAQRQQNGKRPLAMNALLQKVARAHARDMLERGYFSHYTPEGLSPFDRMAQYEVAYSFAGENLAFSPNVQLAMQGLMNSPGHRENILSPHFGKIGIGVLDGGVYGEMFVQEFTD